jgi:fatty acyl-CoA reductase
VLGVKNALDLAKQFTNLEAFVHMSSIYAHGNLSFIEEKIYPHSVEPEKIMNLLEWMEDEWINMATKRLIDGKPNTFTYTKWLSETLLQKETDTDFPLVILRPSTIGAAWKEPFAVCISQIKG